MIIEQIHIKSFGLLLDTTLEFSDSINVIEGENEAGKSTIAAFIKYMLYGFDATDSPDSLSERKKRINWTTKTAEGSMIVRVRDKRYQLTRSTITVTDTPRPTYKEDSAIVDLETGTCAFGKAPAGEVFLGVGKSLFENTAFVGAIGDARIREGAVKESIENILFSGSEQTNIRRAAREVEDKMEALMHRGGVGGVIYDLARKKDDLNAALAGSNEDNAAILQKEAELHQLRMKKQETIERHAKLEDLDSCYKNVMLIQTFDKLHELEKDSEAKAEAYTGFVAAHSHNGFVPEEGYRSEFADARRRVNDTYRDMTEKQNRLAEQRRATGITNEIENAIRLSDEYGGEDALRKTASGLRNNHIRSIFMSVVFALLSIALIVFLAVSGGAAQPPVLFVGTIVLTVLSVLAVAAFAVLSVRSRGVLRMLAARFATETYEDLFGKLAVIAEARAKRDTMFREMEDATRASEDAAREYASAKDALTEVILRWTDEIPDTGLHEFLDEREERIATFLAQKKHLLDEKNITELTVKEIRRTLSDKSEIDIRAQVSPLKRKALSEINHDEIINGIADCKARLVEQDRMIADVENELSVLKTRAKDPSEIYTKIRVLDGKIEEMNMRHKAYEAARRAIECASDRLREEISPRLGKYATDLMEIMTERKYTRFDVSGGLKVTFEDGDGEERSVDFLSGGTQDLTYIAVRMALIDMLYSELPPTTYDESFAHQDNNRARSMMRAIAHLSEGGHQSFIFTCRARESALAHEFDKKAKLFKL